LNYAVKEPLQIAAWTQPEAVISNVVIGTRIPKDFFITKGRGESDITIHAGSYHLALREAGIEMCNIMTYSSILPRPQRLNHGSVMECIMAVADKQRGERATAGIIFGWLYDRQTGRKHGGLVCEYNGSKLEEEAREELRQSLNELYTNGYSDDFDLRDIELISDSFVPEKKYGSCLISLCFTNYVCPILPSA
jgi:arginine decarboxylase